MSDAVEVLLLERHIKDIKDYAEYPNKRLINSLEKALLALERLDRLEKWIDEKIKISEKYPDTQEEAHYLREVREVLEK